MAINLNTIVINTFNEIWLHMNTAVGNGLDTRCHIKWAEFVSACCQRGVGLNGESFGVCPFAVNHFVHQRNDSLKSNHLRQPRVCAVDRKRGHRAQRSNTSTNTLGNVKRFFGLTRVWQSTRQRSINHVVRKNACLQRASQDKHFHAGTCLPPTHCKVDLVIGGFEPCTTDHGANTTSEIVN